MSTREKWTVRMTAVALLFLFTWLLAFGGITVAQAAPLLQEESFVGPVLERIIVIAGAAVLVSAWQRWRERKQKKDGTP